MPDIDGERKIEYVLMDPIGKCTDMCCIRGHNAEDVRPNQGGGQ